jgi:hypothetical protein
MKAKHITEVKYPEQVKEFKKITEELYKLHLQKNFEYSPNNVKALGQLGNALRIFEKAIRLLNILGWDAFEGKLKEKIDVPKFGSVEAELVDIANIAVLSTILGRNKWGK